MHNKLPTPFPGHGPSSPRVSTCTCRTLILLLLLPAAAVARRYHQLSIPHEFDWQAYIRNYPDLAAEGTMSEEDALHHYRTIGAAEGRLYRPVRKLVRYTACTGLFNQYYSHISALALASVLHADVYFPPAATRSSYNDRTSLIPEHNEARWQPVPAETLWDVRRMKQYWKKRGMHVLLVCVCSRGLIARGMSRGNRVVHVWAMCCALCILYTCIHHTAAPWHTPHCCILVCTTHSHP